MPGQPAECSKNRTEHVAQERYPLDIDAHQFSRARIASNHVDLATEGCPLKHHADENRKNYEENQVYWYRMDRL